MAIGTYIGQGGSVRDLKGCYIGQNGSVRTVDAIYVGQGGSVRLVWPPYIYDNGTYSSLGGGSMNFAPNPGSTYPQVTEESTYIMAKNVSSDASSWDSALTGACCVSTIDMSLYKTLSMTYTITRNGLSSNTSGQRLYIGGCTSRPTFNTNGPRINVQGTDYSNYVVIDTSFSTNTAYTLSLDVSSITSGLYVYVGYRIPSLQSVNMEVHITRIEVSA